VSAGLLAADALAAATEGFTPADIEYAARVAAQVAFEREVVHGEAVDARGASTR
jgi:transitional endoplasmic reticulum ATPase